MNHSSSVIRERAPSIDVTAVREDPACAMKTFIARRRAWFEQCVRERIDAHEVNRMSTEMTATTTSTMLSSVNIS